MIGTTVFQSIVARINALKTALADAATAANGAGSIGFLYATAYAGNTIGAWLKGLAGTTGASFIGWISGVTGAIARTVQDKLREDITALDFGALNNGTGDNATAFAAMKTYAASLGQPVELVFPAGTYNYSASPNWAVPGLTLRARGRVVLNFTGTGQAWIFDSPVSNLYNMQMLGDFYITGTATATDGLFVRGCHHSEFEAMIWNVPTGCRVNFSIESRFKLKVTGSGLATTVTPVNGVIMDKRNAGERCGSVWERLTVEGVSGDGVVMNSCDGPVFIQGTSEGNGATGVIQTTDCNNATFVGFWCESNHGIADFELIGYNNTLSGCRATSVTLTGAGNSNVRCKGQGTTLDGGTLRNITVDAASGATTIMGAGMANGAGGIIGTGPYKAVGVYFYDGSFNFVSYLSDIVGEQGTFTPTLIGSTTAGVQTYTGQYGYYTKIGKVVSFTLLVGISAKGAMAGNIVIGGLPYAQRNLTNSLGNVSMQTFDGVTLDAGRTQLSARINAGSSSATLFESGSNVASLAVPVANLAAAASICASGTYLVD